MSPRKHREAGAGSLEEMFRLELETHCASLNTNLLALERREGVQQALQNLMRAAHSIKGAARIVKNRSVERIAHAMEDCFVLSQHGAISLGHEDIDALLKTADLVAQSGAKEAEPEEESSSRISETLAALEKISLRGDSEAATKPADHGATATPSPDTLPGEMALVPTRDRFLRVTAESLSRLLGLAGDSLVESRWLQSFMDSMLKAGKQQTEAEHIAESIKVMLSRLNLPESVRSSLDELVQRIGNTNKALRNGITDLQAHERRLSQVSHRLYLEVLRTRMRPFSDISNAFPRMVRDIAVSLGKEVRFEVTGEGTQVDREVLAAIETAIAQLLRNAIDHGCETPEERQRAGKPPQCSVRLDARHRAGMLVVSVSDDGAGVDPALLRKSGQARYRHADLRATDAELLDMLLLPGFSLKRNVTEISGRGIGLDLVHNVARRLRGSLRIENEHGRGMRFTLQLPLTISVLRALVAVVCDELYAFPLAQTERVMNLAPGEIVLIQGKRHFRSGKEHVPLATAREVFGCPPAPNDTLNVIVLGERKARAGLAVDGFVGERELIVQPLDQRLGKVRDIAGAALMDDGSPVLIIEPEEMIQSIIQHPSLA